MEDLFDLHIEFATLIKFREAAANYYKETHAKMLKKIILSPVVHVDETPIRLRKDSGYVWIFTNMEEVVFCYRPTREGSFIKDLFSDFHGILVSDFYSAYDSLDCLQQKCLIHLIRDMNEDLSRNPFDEEFKEMIQHFSILLRRIVETIDRYGLKKRFLGKHGKEIRHFYKKIVNRDYTSEVAQQYRKRFIRNIDKLFTFIKYDGVPWNNNNAEHAIKHFAVYRRNVKGLLTDNSLSHYLILLSLYQTCQYKQLNFLEFLLSTERQIP